MNEHLPHNGLEVPRTNQALRQPLHPQTGFDYAKFLRLLQTVERGSVIYEWLPWIEETAHTPGSERVANAITKNGEIANDILQRIGGIPVKFAEVDRIGVLTTIQGPRDGKWVSNFRSTISDELGLVQLNAQELHDAYFATKPQD